MKVRDKFATLGALEDAVQDHSQNFMELWKHDVRTVEGARNKGLKRRLNKNLGAYKIHFCCIKGGRQFQSRSTGQQKTGYVKVTKIAAPIGYLFGYPQKRFPGR